MSPIDALIAATANAADLVGLDDHGRLAEGAIADLLVVDGDPTPRHRGGADRARHRRVVKTAPSWSTARPGGRRRGGSLRRLAAPVRRRGGSGPKRPRSARRDGRRLVPEAFRQGQHQAEQDRERDDRQNGEGASGPVARPPRRRESGRSRSSDRELRKLIVEFAVARTSVVTRELTRVSSSTVATPSVVDQQHHRREAGLQTHVGIAEQEARSPRRFPRRSGRRTRRTRGDQPYDRRCGGGRDDCCARRRRCPSRPGRARAPASASGRRRSSPSCKE